MRLSLRRAHTLIRGAVVRHGVNGSCAEVTGPMPTGPLAVFSSALARLLFAECQVRPCVISVHTTLP